MNTPVAYTHLDVYKRQGSSCSMKGLRINTRTKENHYEPFKEEWKIYGQRGLIDKFIEAELDPKCDPLGPDNKLFIVCLLYTSARGCQGSTNDQPRDDAGQADIYDDIFHAIGPSRLQRQDLRADVYKRQVYISLLPPLDPTVEELKLRKGFIT